MDLEQNKKIDETLAKCGLAIDDIHNIDTLIDSYIDYAKDIDKKKINFGFSHLDETIRGLRVQELMTIIAGTGVGKSALVLNFLMNFVKRTNELTILFSLEMSTVGIAERMLQIELDRFGFQIEDGFIKRDENFIQECKKLQESLKSLFVITNRIDIENIPNLIKFIEQQTKRKVRLIGIDYLGLIDNKFFKMNEYLKLSDSMIKLYSYAKTLDIAIINLSQTSRADVKGNDNGLNLYSAKGSGEIEQSSDFVLTLERIQKPTPEESDKIKIIDARNEKRSATEGELELMRLSIQKNRRGKLKKILVVFNRKNLKITEYSEIIYEKYSPILSQLF